MIGARVQTLAACALLAGCAATPPAPVEDRPMGTRSVSDSSVYGAPPQQAIEGDNAVTLPAEDGSGPTMTPIADDAAPARVQGSRVPEAPASAATPRPSASGSANPAVVALVNRANGERSAGRPEQAAAALERALKIEPANAWLWHRLASLRLEQQRHDDAAALAARSNALARGDRSLMARNWRLIAAAHRARGDRAAARAAEDRARRLDPTAS